MTDSKKILVVDDESSLVKLCQIVLENAGFEVRGAFSGKHALNLLDDDMPDLILLDVMMPGMNGIEVCREIRANNQAKRVHIVMYTADSSDSTRRNSIEAGANDLLTKEIPIYDLPVKLNGYLDPNAKE
jgi:DNA-binding response OmpR family regulator